MNVENVVNQSSTLDYEEVLVVYSDNLKCYEQVNFLEDARTFVLVNGNRDGFVAVGAKTQSRGYLTLKLWRVNSPLGFSFSIPATKTYRLKAVPVFLLLTHYASMDRLWETINRYTRSDVIMPLPRGNTHR